MPKHFFRKIHPSYHVVIFTTSVIIGDVLMHIFRTDFFAALPWLFVGLAALSLAIKIPTKPTLLLAAAAGLILISFRAAPDFISLRNFEALAESGTIIELTATIAKDPDISDDGTKIALTLKDPIVRPKSSSETPDDKSAILTGKIYATLSGKTETEKNLRRSDRITLETDIKPGFGTYAAYLYRPKITAVSRPEPGDFFLDLRDTFAAKIRDSLNSASAIIKTTPNETDPSAENLAEDQTENLAKNANSAPESSLALGYLLGIRSGLDENLEESLRTVGLTHIIVASGTHLGILVGFARKFFGKLSRFAGLFSAIFFILIFVGITGLTPSMTRAALVTVISLLAWYFGRDRSPIRILLFAAAATLLYAPTNLLDLAWLLSFASFGGILILSPLLTKFFLGTKSPNFLTETLLSSLAASLACAPILLYFFGSISLISVLANLLILPTISYTLGLTFLTGLLATLTLTPLAALVATITRFLLGYHITVVNFLGQNDYFLIKINPNEPRVFFLYLIFAPLLLVALRHFFKRRRSPAFKPSCRDPS